MNDAGDTRIRQRVNHTLALAFSSGKVSVPTTRAEFCDRHYITVTNTGSPNGAVRIRARPVGSDGYTRVDALESVKLGTSAAQHFVLHGFFNQFEISAASPITGRSANVFLNSTLGVPPQISQSTASSNSTSDKEFSNGVAGATASIDWTLSRLQTVTLTAGTTCAITFSSPPSSQGWLTLRIKGSSAASSPAYTITGLGFTGGTSTINKSDIVNLYYNGSVYYNVREISAA